MKPTSPETKTECLLCGLQFNHRKSLGLSYRKVLRALFFNRNSKVVNVSDKFIGSSLIRHTKNNCNKNQSQRRKSCNQCVANKSKCNLKRPTCSRCSLRHIACEYAGSGAAEPESPGIASAPLGFELETMPTFQPQSLSARFDSSVFEPFFGDLGPFSPFQPSTLTLQDPQHIAGQDLLPYNDYVSFASSDLIQTQSNLQLEPKSEPNSVALANHSMEFIFRVCRTWPQMLADGFQIPPIFHPTHLASHINLPRQLATCITLVKMWHGQCPGAEEIVRATIRQELDQLMDNVSTIIYRTSETSLNVPWNTARRIG